MALVDGSHSKNFCVYTFSMLINCSNKNKVDVEHPLWGSATVFAQVEYSPAGNMAGVGEYRFEYNQLNQLVQLYVGENIRLIAETK